jgi:glycosyltransferase involved in cell wall biosynthesis
MARLNCAQSVSVSHVVGLSGIGGVQRNFYEYVKHIVGISDGVQHKLYRIGEADVQYSLPLESFDIKQPMVMMRLLVDLMSRKQIVHLYNNLSSPKVALLLMLIPVSRLIVHERGTVWNLSSRKGLLVRFVAWKADWVVTNSNATKLMLVKRFKIPREKIRVIHNGIDTSHPLGMIDASSTRNSRFRIGFIGRFDAHKGIHVLIESMRKLQDQPVELLLAGDGVLLNAMKRAADGLQRVTFIGRVRDPYQFMRKIDLLVVPSIREPFGNVCLEAGMCHVPVLAAWIDGIPEIIKHGESGELIEPTQPIEFESSLLVVPLPEIVVSAQIQELVPPLQIDPERLAEQIRTLMDQPELLQRYADRLYCRVIEYFTIDRYTEQLHALYRELRF